MFWQFMTYPLALESSTDMVVCWPCTGIRRWSTLCSPQVVKCRILGVIIQKHHGGTNHHSGILLLILSEVCSQCCLHCLVRLAGRSLAKLSCSLCYVSSWKDSYACVQPFFLQPCKTILQKTSPPGGDSRWQYLLLCILIHVPAQCSQITVYTVHAGRSTDLNTLRIVATDYHQLDTRTFQCLSDDKSSSRSIIYHHSSVNSQQSCPIPMLGFFQYSITWKTDCDSCFSVATGDKDADKKPITNQSSKIRSDLWYLQSWVMKLITI